MESESAESRLARLEQRLAQLEKLLEQGKPSAAKEFVPPFPSTHPSVPPFPKRPLTPPKPIDWEALAGKWFNRVGVVAIVFAVSFFLKYAFDHRWIGELGRVALGILTGMGMLYAGDKFCRKKMPGYGHMLMGGGISVLYLSIYAGFSYYHLLPQAAAFSFMCLITAGACALAIRQNALSIALVGIVGGFLTPKLMSTGVVQEQILFGYLTMLNLGVLAVSFFKDWRGINLLALLFTQIYVQGYVSIFYTSEHLGLMEFYLTAYWIIFMVASVGFYIREGKNSRPQDVGLALLNAGTFFGTLYRLLKPHYHDWLGFLCLVIAGVYACLAISLNKREKIDRNLVLTHLGLAIVFLTLAVPIQFDLKWVTIGWAVEAAVLFAAGFKLNHKEARFMAAGVLLVAILRALFVDSFLSQPHAFLFNQRGLSFVCVLAAIVLCINGYRQLADPHDEEKGFRSFFGVSGVFLGLWFLSLEGREFWTTMSPESKLSYFGPGYEGIRNLEIAKSFSISAVWGLYGFAWFLYGVWQERRPIRLLALVILSVTVLKVFLIDLSFLRTIWRILSLFGLGMVTMAVSYFYQRDKKITT
ncbi:MAG: DUF2339 domain-containing protein [Elusimicrobia bacterium]|nr:DUF2339 domain-containing protein [Elusimicrobiota bacterium]